MTKKLYFLISFVLVLTLASISYGRDTTPPAPTNQTWAVPPSSSGLTSIYMKATHAVDNIGPAPDDANHPPVEYYFECLNDPCKSRNWGTAEDYTATGLTRGTIYRFRVRARDSNSPTPNMNNWSSVRYLSGIEVAGSVRLDMNHTTDNNDANTEPGWKPFIIANSGSEVNAVTIDLTGSIKSARRPEPNSVLGYGTVYTEQVYRDMFYGEPGGITITLWGLGVNRDCNVTLWAFDAKSEPNRIADWYGNDEYLFTTDFKGEDPTLWPTTLNPCHDAYKTTVTVQADALGRLVLESFRNTKCARGLQFAFVNGLVVMPKGTYNEPNQAQRPVPFDEAENVAVATTISWKASTLAGSHDVYFGPDFDDVNTANRITTNGVLVSRNQTGTSYNPYGSDYLEVGQTYYWRIDEVNAPAPLITKGEIWSFTTVTCATIENFSSYTTANIYKTWEDYRYNYTGAEVLLQTISEGSKYVHGGSGQSMKLEYDNNLDPPDVVYNYAEAEATIGTGTDELNIDPNWLRMAVKSLSVWFRGTAGNDTGEPMYVKLTDDASNSAAVFYDGDPEDTALEEWQEWVIDMNNFTADMNADNTYDANVTDSNLSNGVTGSTNGYGSMWYYYPESRWWNIWLDNGRYDRHRKKDIWITLIVKRRNVGQAAKAEFLMGGATALWMADPNGSIRPPLPSDVNALTEPNYIDRTAHEPNVFYPTASYQIINLHITLPWNPRWVFLDIRGYNFDIIGGIIRHRCRSYLNLGRMKKIALGFGYDVVPRGSGAGIVYFDDIGLCSTRCALGKRPCGLALTDYAPGGAPSGDCLIDYKEIKIMATTWLAEDSAIDTNNPGTANLTACYHFDEGSGKTTVNSAPGADPCSTGYLQRDPNKGWPVEWTSPGVIWDPCTLAPTGNAIHFNGKTGERMSCGSGWNPLPNSRAMTLAIWAKWAGRHTDREKCQGLISKRIGWGSSGTGVVWMFECDTVPGPRGSFSLRQRNGNYDVYSAGGILDSFIGQWVHLAATFEGSDVLDSNGYYSATARLYLNATQVGVGRYAFGKGDPCAIDLTIGQNSDATEQGVESFKGDLDEAYIFNRVLEVNEIGYLADVTPWDYHLMIPVPSAAEIYKEEPEGSRVVNFKDFALVANNWLVGFEWP